MLLSSLANFLGGPLSTALFLILPLVICTQFFYNALFHPLAKVPGPFWCKVSALPSWYHAVRGNRHIWLWQLFTIYGPKVRIAPTTVLFRDPQAFGDIYSQKANVQKAPFYEAWQKDINDVNTFSTRDKAAHARRRKILNRAFTEKSLKSAESFIIKHVDRWNELLPPQGDTSAEWSDPQNFAKVGDNLVFDIMGELCFGRSFDIKEPGENPLRIIPHAVAEYMTFLYPFTRGPMIEFMLWIKPRGLDQLFKLLTPPHIKHYISFVDECVQKRLELYEAQKDKHEGEQRLDMFWFLCDLKDDEGQRAYSNGELHAEANMLIVGGLDTTSTTLTGFMFYLTRDSLRYTRLVNEIRSTFSSAEDIVDGEKLSSCVYLRACIDETLRISPSGPSELPRQVLKGGAKIMGDFYPEGTVVGAAGWSTGHDSDFWGDSEVWRPERWIPDEKTGVTPEDVRRARSNSHPFAAGPGSCPGKNLAILELSIAIGRTLHRLDVRKPQNGDTSIGEGNATLTWGMRNQAVFQLGDAYISLRDGPLVQFKKRAD